MPTLPRNMASTSQPAAVPLGFLLGRIMGLQPPDLLRGEAVQGPVEAEISRLGQEGFHLAIVSNKFDSAVKGLCQTYVEGLIPVAIGESQGVAHKPAPDTVFKALQELGVPAEGAVYIGDSDVDIATARNAGLPCISVSWGFRDRDFLLSHGATEIVSNPQELYAALTDEKER